eukprot:3764709-Rhodomonas_salina.1
MLLPGWRSRTKRHCAISTASSGHVPYLSTARYAMSGTEIASAALSLRACYGTDLACATARGMGSDDAAAVASICKTQPRYPRSKIKYHALPAT